MCPQHKRLASSELSADSRALAAQMFRSPVESFAAEPWSAGQYSDLRKFLVQILERHIEKKLVTAGCWRSCEKVPPYFEGARLEPCRTELAEGLGFSHGGTSVFKGARCTSGAEAQS